MRGVIDNAPHSLKAAVASEALDSDDITCFFKDLVSHGCQSGMIGSLIYYSDTHNFYDRFYHEIEELRYDLEQSIGEALQPNGDLKNWFAWLGFEEPPDCLQMSCKFIGDSLYPILIKALYLCKALFFPVTTTI